MQFEYVTDRLIIKVLNYSSASKVLDFLYANRDVFEPFEAKKNSAYYTESYQEATLQAEYNSFLKQKYIRYYIFTKENPDTIIGTISATNIRQDPYFSCSIGYKIAQNQWHKGYASESIKCICNALFNELNINRIEASVMHNNIASMKLLNSLGFTNEGLCYKNIKICDRFENHYRYSLIKH